jgi:hypothetical protein
VSCGGGTQSRTCTNPSPANGGLVCAGSASQSCNTNPCPVNCVGSWSDTNTCSLACGGGVKQQVYIITTPAANGGVSCPTANGATRWGGTSCNTGGCPVAGVCGGSANSCSAGTAVGYSAGSCGGSKTWSCNGVNGGANASCSLANASCAVIIPGNYTGIASIDQPCGATVTYSLFATVFPSGNVTLTINGYTWAGGDAPL